MTFSISIVGQVETASKFGGQVNSFDHVFRVDAQQEPLRRALVTEGWTPPGAIPAIPPRAIFALRWERIGPNKWRARGFSGRTYFVSGFPGRFHWWDTVDRDLNGNVVEESAALRVFWGAEADHAARLSSAMAELIADIRKCGVLDGTPIRERADAIATLVPAAIEEQDQ